MKKTKKQGFTLVEIMIVVAIIGLLAAIGIPSILNAMSNAQDKAKLRNIADVMKAKGMCVLPTDMGGINATNGQVVAAGIILSHMDGVSTLSDLEVGGDPITIGAIGTEPTY